MAYISKVQFKNIVETAPPGTTPAGLARALVKQGHTLEGLNDENGILNQQQATNPSQQGQQTQGQPEEKSVGGFIKNIGSSAANLVKGTLGAAVNVFNPDSKKNTLANLGRVALGTVEKAIPGRQGAEDQADAVGNMLKERYGGWDNIKKTAYEDPLGFLLDASTVLDGAGIALRAAGTAGKVSEVARAGEMASKASQFIDPIQAATKAATGAARVGEKVVGATTGVGSTAVREGFNAAVEGGAKQQAFTGAMRSTGTGEDLLGTAKDALSNLKEQRATTYKKQLSGMKGSSQQIDLTPVKTKTDEMLSQFGIKQAVDEQGNTILDFKTSTVSDPAEQARVQRIYNDVQTWNDFTPVGVDTLKRRIANEFSPNSDVRAFTQAIKNETRTVLKDKVPGYEAMTKGYEQTSDMIDDIQKNLSLGDRAAVETGIKKLTGAMKQNNEFRLELIKHLEANGAENLTSQIAGNAMSSVTPRGIMNPLLAAGGLTMAHLTQFLPALLMASPRVVGEFVNALGTGVRYAEKAKVPQATKAIVRTSVPMQRTQ